MSGESELCRARNVKARQDDACFGLAAQDKVATTAAKIGCGGMRGTKLYRFKQSLSSICGSLCGNQLTRAFVSPHNAGNSASRSKAWRGGAVLGAAGRGWACLGFARQGCHSWGENLHGWNERGNAWHCGAEHGGDSHGNIRRRAYMHRKTRFSN